MRRCWIDHLTYYSGRVIEYEWRRKRELMRIKRKEALKQLHRKIGRVLHPDKAFGRIHLVDIPQCDPAYDGKACDQEGSWTSVCNPEEVARHVFLAMPNNTTRPTIPHLAKNLCDPYSGTEPIPWQLMPLSPKEFILQTQSWSLSYQKQKPS
jgi:hypothetical protein